MRTKLIVAALVGALAFITTVARAADALPSWNDGKTKQSILDFVAAPAPEGMVWIPGGEFSMGSDAASESLCGLPGLKRDALPIHRVYADSFWMDATEVTNEQFEKFVKALRSPLSSSKGWVQESAERQPPT